MKGTRLLAFLLLLTGFFVSLQASNVDSLQSLLETNLEAEERVDILLELGYSLRFSDFETAIDYGGQALVLAEENDLRTDEARAYNFLGLTYSAKGAYQMALENLFKALKIRETLSDSSNLAWTYNNLGSVYTELENYEQARLNFVKAEKIWEATNEKENLAGVHLNLGVVEEAMGNAETSVERYFLCLRTMDQIGSQNLMLRAICLNNIGVSYLHAEDFGKSETYLRQALDQAKASQLLNFEIGFANNLGENLIRQGRFSEAETYLRRAESLSIKLGTDQEKSENYALWSLFYEEQGQAGKALEYFKKFSSLKDSLRNSESEDRIAKLQVAYDYDRQQAKIALLESETAAKQKEMEATQARDRERVLQMLALIGGLILVTAVVVLLFFGNRRQKSANDLLMEKNVQIENARAILLQRNDQLEDLNREKDGLIHVVAHDLKAPLNKTLGLAEVLDNGGPLTPTQEHALGLIRKVNREGGELIRSLLDVHAVEHQDSEMEIEPIDLNQLVRDQVDGFQKQAQAKNIQLSFVPENGAMPTQSDLSALRRILDNLISNALKFSPRDTSVEVRTFRHPDGVGFAVEDHGPGISEEDQQKLFKKFQKLSARPTAGESSSGLGLAIVKTLLQQLNGDIFVESTLGRGTEFRVVLPKGEPVARPVRVS